MFGRIAFRLLGASGWVLFGILVGCAADGTRTDDGTAGSARISVEPFGVAQGRPVLLYTLTNAQGCVAKISTYGAIVTELHVPDREGKMADIVLGFDDLDSYLAGHPYFGAIAGRVANRIALGKFELDGQAYQLATNNGPNHLHGGDKGFDKVIWSATPQVGSDGVSLVLTYRSTDGEEGYPGNVDVQVIYTLSDANELIVDMSAETDAPTPINLAHHSYWNLAGHDSGSILDHELAIAAARYTPVDDTLIPTGQIAPVAGTPFDFSQSKRIGHDIGRLQAEDGAAHGGGYDLNYVVDGTSFRLVARLEDLGSGRVMKIYSDQPGIQLYTGNWLGQEGEIRGKGGAVYAQYQGLCLETQHYPDSINHPEFPPVVLRPGETYTHRMVHKFSTRKLASH